MAEFGNMDVYCLRPDGKLTRTTLEELVPFAFNQQVLSEGQGKAEEEDE